MRGVVVRHLVFAGVILAVTAVAAVGVVPGLMDGRLFDPDGYMRLVRVERLLETGAWYDGRIPGSNAPFGETLHWTRPLDVILLAFTALLEPVLPTAEALHGAGVFVAPLLLVALCFVVSWVVTTLVDARWQIYGMLAVLGQLGVMGYALPGRPDHHILLLLVFAGSVGLLVKWMIGRPSPRVAFAAGGALGLGLWVGPEAAVVVGVAFTALGVRWVVRGAGARETLLVSLGLAVTVAFALLVERPPSDLLAVEHDRISVVHLLPAIATALFWLVVAIVARGATAEAAVPGGGDRFSGRVAVALLGVAFVLGVQALVFPASFLGPTADVDPVLLEVWLARVEEYGPFLRPEDVGGVGRLVAFLGLGLIGLPFLAVRGARERDPGRREAWLLLAFLMAVYVPLAILRVRFAAYPGVLFAITIPALLARLEPVFARRFGGWRRDGARTVAGAALIVGPLFLGAAGMTAGGRSAGAIRAVQAEAATRCRLADVAPLLDRRGTVDAGPIVLARVDLGPEILYRTGARVVATPYHRNAEGILDVARFMGATDPAAARDVVERRGVDLVLVCGPAPSLAGVGSRGTLRTRLLGGEPPSWLRPVPLELAGGTGFRLYEVR